MWNLVLTYIAQTTTQNVRNRVCTSKNTNMVTTHMCEFCIINSNNMCVLDLIAFVNGTYLIDSVKKLLFSYLCRS